MTQHHQHTSGKSARRQQWRVRGIVLFILLIALAWWLASRIPLGPDALFDRFFTEYSLPDGALQTARDETHRAFLTAYAAGEYRIAATLYARLEATDDLDRLMYGVGHLALRRPVGGIGALMEAAQEGSAYRNQAQWYLALAYVKLGDAENARILLRELTARAGDQHQQAEALLRKLRD
ncbi:MAG: hypothetical protein R3301_01845 [Saprospiraceae bacterium]|nr:hypothetical protein [Saprospiraceae bacterium]